MRALPRVASLVASVVVAATAVADPQYQIFDLGVVEAGGLYSAGLGVSPAGIAIGSSAQGNGFRAEAFYWTLEGGIVGLPNLADLNHSRALGANDSGIVVGITQAAAPSGANRRPIVWQNGVASLLPLPAGYGRGDAHDVNASGVAVGSAFGPATAPRGVIYSGGTGTIITQTTSKEALSARRSASMIQAASLERAAIRTRQYVAIVYDIGSASAFDIGTLPGYNRAIAWDVNNAGIVVGVSTQNGTMELPFIWSDANGMVAIPLASGTTQASAQAVNSAGWVVGIGSFPGMVPFLYDGTTTYRLEDLIPAGSGWDLSTNSSSTAYGISDNGVIVGTGVHNGETRAYVMVPATPTPGPSGNADATPSPTPTPGAQTINLSTRMRVQTGDNIGIGGFIITGTGSKHLLLRVIGPSLTDLGIPNALPDPVLELHGPAGFATITNNNWRDDPAQEALIEASGIPPPDDFESAIDANLNPGAYTAVVRGNNNSVGVALIEVYDLGLAVPAKLGNISTRAFVSTGNDIVIAGFILGNGSGNDRVVVRGIGPSLTDLGVPDALPDPTLELRDSNGTLLMANDDWEDNPAQAAELSAAGLAPANNLESGIAATLPPGPYTALLAGLSNVTGNGVVEVYDRGP